ncbi:hypothetical protein TRFO_26316 [Tritrichomonas foetus]|uniref:EF-hand domain-containing protein n=1 Tax=Tritrichomonas foetus TaxID=1144522 RepID=A0A1J4K7Z9_9EUKA|nr:hypothetical protein TRFO_26316 [Tritrichomonas foetus]|eukprot:OHT05814.1 hypothetical protein TRFO_26316 [Tritrichomonas foetus]
MNAFQAQYYKEQKNEIYSTLLFQKDIEVAKEFQKIRPSSKITIPIFSNKFSFFSNNEINSLNIKNKLQKNNFKTLSQSQLDKISRILDYPNKSKIGVENIDFNCIAQDIDSHDQIISKKVIKQFTKKSYFDSKNYIDFIRHKSLHDQAFFRFLEIDPTTVDSISVDTFRCFLESYSSNIKSLERLNDDLDYFQEYYFEIVTTIFIFHLCHLKNSIIPIASLFTSNLLLQYMNMDYFPKKKNELSLKLIIDYYSLFVKLADGSELLYQRHIKTIKNVTFTDVFLESLFEELQLYEGGLDMTLFITLILALNNMTNEVGTDYFFTIIDIDKKGYISQYDILYFYKGMIQEIELLEHDFDSFYAKLLDIAKCNEKVITKDVLVQSKTQDAFFKMLFDINTFKELEDIEDDN